ncbi:uncharacterized protein BBA_01299 [Beauveria bassiana ARSEF 2860]|uniref:F-box domain-containing protein n=1 Tax=Beauveria bassiana (strain ARSEF 2860) TaxID=655819 RepID=J4KQJ9_BEAB2|nr:uncharacterized protein BBA_01299 [Beauveria bassiana ARSEF 2860]EJP69334.1 hypothetical protein BBA_01299 [Beauveria bassiana ARSEF 2860]
MSTPRDDDLVTQSHVAVSDARDYFNLLPNEVFTLVLDFVRGPEIDFKILTEMHVRKAKKDLHDLTLVNRRFNALATPLLNDATVDRTIMKVLGSATHLNSLIVSGSFIIHCEMILTFIKLALASSKSLRHLSVLDIDRNTSTSDIIEALTESPSSIQELFLDGMVCCDESIPSFVPLQNNDTASLRKLHLHNIFNNPEATMKSLFKWSESLEELSLRARDHKYFKIDLKNLLSPYKDTLVVLYLDIRIAPDGIDFSSLAALEELTLIYWPLIASTRVEFSEELGRRLLAPRMRRLNWLLVGDTKPDLSINSLTTFDKKWLCDFGEYATQHCSRLRIICTKHH